jgi:hypothetical protein
MCAFTDASRHANQVAPETALSACVGQSIVPFEGNFSG